MSRTNGRSEKGQDENDVENSQERFDVAVQKGVHSKHENENSLGHLNRIDTARIRG